MEDPAGDLPLKIRWMIGPKVRGGPGFMCLIFDKGRALFHQTDLFHLKFMISAMTLILI